jgi:hypothetical protein
MLMGQISQNRNPRMRKYATGRRKDNSTIKGEALGS